jgi:SET domain-containing protein
MLLASLYIGINENKGRGIFTRKAIKGETIIEVAPVLVMSAEDRKLLDTTLLHDYIFEWQPGGQQLCCMALGWIPLYNHSYHSNCEYFMDYEAQTMKLLTVRPIALHEELTINYNGDWNDETPIWFEAVE